MLHISLSPLNIRISCKTVHPCSLSCDSHQGNVCDCHNLCFAENHSNDNKQCVIQPVELLTKEALIMLFTETKYTNAIET